MRPVLLMITIRSLQVPLFIYSNQLFLCVSHSFVNDSTPRVLIFERNPHGGTLFSKWDMGNEGGGQGFESALVLWLRVKSSTGVLPCPPWSLSSVVRPKGSLMGMLLNK